jgi:ATP-dependent DNA helicase DinG
MIKVFGEGGWLSKELDGYRPRKGQDTLAVLTLSCLTRRAHLIAEAPTGTGKSLGYGIPAAMLAMEGGGTVVIATANITLQEQLINKDLPLIGRVIEKNLGKELKYSLVKGMSNYLCKDKVRALIEDGKAGSNDELDILLRWETDTGDRSDLEVSVSEDCWSEVCCSSDDCTRGKCDFHDNCFALASRYLRPHVVVTNYHMLYTDVLVRQATKENASILPEYRHLVMDEAHMASDIAMSFNGFEIGLHSIKRDCRPLFDSPHHRSLAQAIVNSASRFFDRLREIPAGQIFLSPLGFGEELPCALREGSRVLQNFVKNDLDLSEASNAEERSALGRKAARLYAISKTLHKKASYIEDLSVGVDGGNGKKVLKEHHVYYTSNVKGFVKLCCKVVDAKNFLRKNLFDTKTVIAVSATMTAPDSRGRLSLEFSADSLGLRDGEYVPLTVDSPFDDAQMFVVIPRGVPPPNSNDHSLAVAKIIETVVKDIGGRTMALFTSYRALKIAEDYLFPRLGDIKILSQESWEKSKLINQFKRNSKSVILATSSFWQGVDIPGEDLSCVVIEKFPFLPPTDPVLQYINRWYGDQGKSSFQSYCIPKAVIALKQGVGRLIRTETDYGAVVLCDNRIETTRYGGQFYQAFPEGCLGSEDGDIRDVKRFLESRS